MINNKNTKFKSQITDFYPSYDSVLRFPRNPRPLVSPRSASAPLSLVLGDGGRGPAAAAGRGAVEEANDLSVKQNAGDDDIDVIYFACFCAVLI